MDRRVTCIIDKRVWGSIAFNGMSSTQIQRSIYYVFSNPRLFLCETFRRQLGGLPRLTDSEDSSGEAMEQYETPAESSALCKVFHPAQPRSKI